LLRAFADDATLHAANAALDARGYHTHEFGDSMLVGRRGPYVPCRCEGAERPAARCRVQLAEVM
jgi:hypothetical protein